jgi:hypothetical protein
MNIKTFIAAVAVAMGSAPALAAEATQLSIDASVLTRAEVRAELARAIASGEMDERGESYGSFPAANRQPTSVALSREAVVAELQRARTAGELDVPGEAYGSFNATAASSTRTRADVRAEIRTNGLSRGNKNRDYTGG